MNNLSNLSESLGAAFGKPHGPRFSNSLSSSSLLFNALPTNTHRPDTLSFGAVSSTQNTLENPLENPKEPPALTGNPTLYNKGRNKLIASLVTALGVAATSIVFWPALFAMVIPVGLALTGVFQMFRSHGEGYPLERIAQKLFPEDEAGQKAFHQGLKKDFTLLMPEHTQPDWYRRQPLKQKARTAWSFTKKRLTYIEQWQKFEHYIHTLRQTAQAEENAGITSDDPHSDLGSPEKRQKAWQTHQQALEERILLHSIEEKLPDEWLENYFSFPSSSESLAASTAASQVKKVPQDDSSSSTGTASNTSSTAPQSPAQVQIQQLIKGMQQLMNDWVTMSVQQKAGIVITTAPVCPLPVYRG